MKITKASIAATLAGACVFAAGCSDEPDRLLPEEEAGKITLSSRMDGRAAYVTIVNESSLVVTMASMWCAASPERTAAHLLPPPSKVDGSNYASRDYKSSEHELAIKLLPGESHEHYFEVSHPYNYPSISCDLKDARGRAKLWFEF